MNLTPPHIQTLKVKKDPTPSVAANIYGELVGKVNGPLSDADNNHVFIPIFVAAGTGAGVWKVAFNVESNAAPKAAQYHVVDEAIATTDFPKGGFYAKARLSYQEIGLKTSEFKLIQNGMLRTVVHSTVSHAELVAVYGFTFPGGGIHDVHYNNGEPAGSGHSNRPNEDGALAVYFHETSGQAVRRWIFIKFQSQHL